MRATDDAMACEELVELVTDYLENHLSASERIRFETHLAECSGCRTYLDQMRLTLRALGMVSAETIQAEARKRLLDVYRAWKVE